MNFSCKIETLTPKNIQQAACSPKEIAEFLHKHLEAFGDPIEEITEAVDYALGKKPSRQGFVLIARLTPSGHMQKPGVSDNASSPVRGVLVCCETGMKRFVPENLIVYIAVDPAIRGQGIGKALVQEAIKRSKGGIALHVEADNPARRLYERLGFTNKYLEMRLNK